METYICTCVKEHPSTHNFVAQSSGDYVAIFSSKPSYKLNRKKRFSGHRVAGFNLGLDISPDGSLLASGSSDGMIYYWNWNSGYVLKSVKGHGKATMDVKFHPVLPSTVASCSWAGDIKVWQ
eukprot:TRINITY_DN3436_c0_g3_i1.p1 TRINITY_DN3436_c0_g3~~TRINITY_DN3436_c0_g3_i1.p1  ORF type:complete len:122 (+),score=23.74 TRINITY_DN3436_c0_g3_i1:149-514(+)